MQSKWRLKRLLDKFWKYNCRPNPTDSHPLLLHSSQHSQTSQTSPGLRDNTPIPPAQTTCSSIFYLIPGGNPRHPCPLGCQKESTMSTCFIDYTQVTTHEWLTGRHRERNRVLPDAGGLFPHPPLCSHQAITPVTSSFLDT